MSKQPANDLFSDLAAKDEVSFSNLTVLSMGLGQDSHTILFKYVFDPEFRRRYAPGKLLVLFADTHNEHDMTYQYRDEVTIPFCKKHGIEFVCITNDMGYHANTWQSLTGQWENGKPTVGSVAYVKSCTHKLKLEPQWRYVERLLSDRYDDVPFDARKRAYVHFAKYYGKIRWLVGIAKGEESRVAEAEKEKRVWKRQAIVVEYPLIDLGMNRADCQHYIRGLGYPVPMPSNCMFCPYGSNHLEILWMYHAIPERFYEWVAYEQAKLDAHTDVERNLGVSGRLHKEGERKGEAITLLDLLEEAKLKYPDATLEQLQEYKWSHGHCVESKY